jgi:hypothetical protein
VAGGNKGGAAKPKTRGAALDDRLDFVEELLVRACTSKEIKAACAQKWRISPRQAEDYVAKVHDRWSEERDEGRAGAKERQRRRVMRVIRRADEDRDFRAMIAAEALLSKIDGTEYSPGDEESKDTRTRIVVRRGGKVVS